VRDLALRRSIEEIDMASDATPEQVAALFERTEEIGRAFGTLLVHTPTGLVQHTTFRLESVYRDARHPDQVGFSSSLELDAKRRDFTCNAMYLDPLDDTFRDPEGGLEDLKQGRLRCVGDPWARLQEDALRMVRMARFGAALDLDVDPGALEAARSSAGRLALVAVERILVELERIVVLERAAAAVRLLDACGLLEAILPGWTDLGGRGPQRPPEMRARVFEGLGARPTPEQGIALLLDPRLDARKEADPLEQGRAFRMLERLKPSRELRRGVAELWKLRADLERMAAGGGELAERRADAIRLIRAGGFPGACMLSRAWMAAQGLELTGLERLEGFAASLSASDLNPEPLLSSSELLELGLSPGPAFGALQERLEELQLAAKLTSRNQALAFARKHIAECAGQAPRDQDGGKTPRSQMESG
jgi:tRNA nucleotidyltransferase (CCA-adding enzyme)